MSHVWKRASELVWAQAPYRLGGFVGLSALCLLGLTAVTLLIFTQLTRAQQPNLLTPQQPLPVTVRIVFPTAEDSPIVGGLTPIVVEVREQVSERGVFWTERLLIGIEGLVLLDTKQLSNGTYDPATQEMVYRVTAPLLTAEMPLAQTFVWTQAQWVGVPLGEPNAPAYREGTANDTVDVTVDNNGSLTVFPKSTTASAKQGTNTQAGTSERVGTSGQRVKRGRRSVNALRREAQRRLRQARRPQSPRRGGRTVMTAHDSPRTTVKRDPPPYPQDFYVMGVTPPVLCPANHDVDCIIGGRFGMTVTGVSFGPGITVNSFSRIDSTSVRANITVLATATAGDRDVTVTTDGVVATALGDKKFTVVTVELEPDLYEGFRADVYEDLDNNGNWQSVFWRDWNGVLQLYTGRDLDKSGIKFTAKVKLTGGGTDGKRGIEFVRVRFLQHVTHIDGCINYINPDLIPIIKPQYILQGVTFPLVDRSADSSGLPFPFYGNRWYISSETDTPRTLSVGDSPAIESAPWQQPDGRILVSTPETFFFYMYLVYQVDFVPSQIISRAAFNWYVNWNGVADVPLKTWTPAGAGIFKGFPIAVRTKPKKEPPIATEAIGDIEENCMDP